MALAAGLIIAIDHVARDLPGDIEKADPLL